jgi:hypothetical protein
VGGKVLSYMTRQHAVTITGTRKNGQAGTLNISSATQGPFKLNGQLFSTDGVDFEITPVDAANDDGSFNEISIEMSYSAIPQNAGRLYISSDGESMSFRAVTTHSGTYNARFGVVPTA